MPMPSDREFAKQFDLVKARAGMDSVNKHLGKLKKVYADLLQEQPVFRHATEAVFKTKAQINRAAILSLLSRPAIEHANRGKELRAQLKKIYDASVTYGFNKHMPNESLQKVQVVLEGAEEQVEEQPKSNRKAAKTAKAADTKATKEVKKAKSAKVAEKQPAAPKTRARGRPTELEPEEVEGAGEEEEEEEEQMEEEEVEEEEAEEESKEEVYQPPKKRKTGARHPASRQEDRAIATAVATAIACKAEGRHGDSIRAVGAVA